MATMPNELTMLPLYRLTKIYPLTVHSSITRLANVSTPLPIPLQYTGSPKPIRCRVQITEGKAQGPSETGVDKSGIIQHSTNSLAELCVIALDREDYLIFIHAYARHSSVTVSVMPLKCLSMSQYILYHTLASMHVF